MPKILIVGGNAAGMTAASRARRLDPRLEITILERSSRISYSTCGIPYYLAGDVAADDLVAFTPSTLASDRNIDAHVNVQVDEILPSGRRVVGVRTDTGETVMHRFDRALIATGVRPTPPDIPGTSLGNVYTITTLDEAEGARPALEAARNVVIVGGGYVGLEMTESLRRMGKRVTIFERNPHLLASVDADMARIIEYEVGRFGVGVETSSGVEAIVGSDGRASGVKTRGTLGVRPADVVLLDTGVRPNTDLAASAGVRTGPTGGIAVSEHMETNVPGVFAAGNCAETFCLLRRRPVLSYIGTVAAKQGRVAGENLAGRRSRFNGAIGTTILRAFELGIGRTGLTSAEAAAERMSTVSGRIEALDRASYQGARRIWVKLIVERESRRLIGAQVVGYGEVARRIDTAASAITAGMRIEDVAQLDLAYTPPYGTLWDPLLVAAQSILRQL